MRQAEISRNTAETQIQVHLSLDGSGQADVQTDIGFFDHMLNHLARHGGFDLRVNAQGDLHIDGHHTVEDVGICLGRAFSQALGEPRGIARYGHAVTPMDEALAEAAVDVSGRPYLHFGAALPRTSVGGFDAELTEEFFRAFAMNARLTVHLGLRYGENAHHCIEALFKACARALRAAVARDAREESIPSTKGQLDI
ncbi:MAG: imidazoleglycerol-phosphate dehydratase HisB [Candidatus Hydrogenedentota bacterium]